MRRLDVVTQRDNDARDRRKASASIARPPNAAAASGNPKLARARRHGGRRAKIFERNHDFYLMRDGGAGTGTGARSNGAFVIAPVNSG